MAKPVFWCSAKQGRNAPFTRLARELRIADRLVFVGATHQPERYFHALHICVHPARIEEFGQVVQEAMACGIPVVSTRAVGAMGRLPSAFYNARPLRPDIEILTHQLFEITGSAERRAHWAEIGHQAVVHNTDQANFEATYALYRRAGLPAGQIDRSRARSARLG